MIIPKDCVPKDKTERVIEVYRGPDINGRFTIFFYWLEDGTFSFQDGSKEEIVKHTAFTCCMDTFLAKHSDTSIKIVTRNSASFFPATDGC